MTRLSHTFRTLLAMLFIITALSPALFGQELFRANHPELVWKTIETEHFLVHYHQGSERTANVLSDIAEEIYPDITGYYQWEPSNKTEFVVKDTDDYANGAAFFFDNKVEIWAPNLNYVLRGTHNWLKDVVTHEFTHIVSLGKALKFGRRVPANWLQGFGYENERREDVVRGFPNVIISYPWSGITIPAWFAEGVAQFQAPNKRFDYRDSHREMILRDRMMTGELLDLNQMDTFGKNSIGNESAYNQGFAFTRYLAETYGDDVLPRLAGKASSPFTFSFRGVLKSVTGVDAKQLHAQWKAGMLNDYTARLTTVNENLLTGESFVEEGIGNMHPTLSPSGDRVAYLATGDADYLSQNKLIIENLSDGKKKTISARITRSLSWSKDGRYLAYAKVTPVEGTLSLYNDIYIYDTKEGKEHRLTRALRARHPDFSHDGKKLVFVVESDAVTNLFALEMDNLADVLENGKYTDGYYDFAKHRIVAKHEAVVPTSDKKGKRGHYFRKVGYKAKLIQLTKLKDARQFYHPRWSPDDSYIVFDTSIKFGRDIAKIPAAGGELEFILNEAYGERDPVFRPGTDELFYASDKTGIFNVYSYNMKTGNIKAHTNVVGGAFMPTVTESGDMFFALYRNQGYKLHRIKELQSVAPTKMQYIGKYEERIPDIAIDETVEEAKPAIPYKRRFSNFSIQPRLMLDYGTVKPGLYFYTNELLDKLLLLGGADINLRRDYNLFGIFEYNQFKPTFFMEVYNQTANIDDKASFEGTGVSDVDIDINFNLLEFNAGLQGQILPGPLKRIHARLAWIFSLYRAKLKIDAYTDPVSNEFFDVSTLRYTYLKGNALSLSLKHDAIENSLEKAINPRKGRYVTVKAQQEWNDFLVDFATNSASALEQFGKNNFMRFEGNWEEYIPVPFTDHHSLSFRAQGAYIQSQSDSLDDFFDYFAGGLVGLKGYPFYSIQGQRMAIATATYRFPLWRNINKQILNVHFNHLYLAGYYQIGNAWNGKAEINDFKENLGVQLRLDTYSWYLFPTRVFFEAAYPLQEQFNDDVRYKREWRYYVGVLFDFDLRLEKRLFR
ncbi:MAG: BamA/TamA family outer membrane protein [Calditrichia bacterium]